MGETESGSCVGSADDRGAAGCGNPGRPHGGNKDQCVCSPECILRWIEWHPDRDHLLDFYAMLLAMAAHDLRQPLQVIVSTHEMLSERLAAAAERVFFERADRASAQLAARLDLLLEALRIEVREGRVQTRPVVLEPLFRRLAQEFVERARHKRVTLRIARSPAMIRSDPILIDTILRNLISNAIAHNSDGGRVLVGCRRRGAMLCIEVRDNGKGISPEDLTRIFDAFHRLDATHSEGFGLGLFIVRHAAALLGHRVEVRSAIGRGSCFTVIAETAAR